MKSKSSRDGSSTISRSPCPNLHSDQRSFILAPRLSQSRGSLRHIASILASLGLAATAVIAEEEPDLDDPSVKAKIVAAAVLRDTLEEWKVRSCITLRIAKLHTRDGVWSKNSARRVQKLDYNRMR